MKFLSVCPVVLLAKLTGCEQIPWKESINTSNNMTMDGVLPVETYQIPEGPVSLTQASEDSSIPNSHSSSTQKAHFRIPIKNDNNLEYSTTISIGTPPQPITVGLDTGSANLWVRSITCKTEPCESHQSYNSSASSTYEKNGSPFEIDYGSADNARVVGHLSRDTIHVGGLSVPGQLFAEATELEGALFRYSKVDGILGLGFQKHAVGEVITPVESMVSQGLLGEPVFAVYFGDARREGDESEMMIGGVDRERYDGELVTLQPWREYEWDIAFDAIAFGEEVFALENTGASIDTGCAMIMIPSDLAETINTKMGGTKDSNGDYVIPCEARATLPDITFTFGGHPFTIGPDAYVVDEGDRCISAFFGQDNKFEGGQFAVIGWVFLREWYSVFNVQTGTIGFARAKRG